MLFEKTIYTQTFEKWLYTDKENRRLLLLSGIAIIIQFLIFKFYYPYPNFMPPDSYSYLQAAYDRDLINMWAIGYSWFLRFFPFITRESITLVWFQYILLELSVLYFLFSVRYLLSPGKWLFRILMVWSLLNPLLPHICNFVSSDALFTAVSLTWLTQILWLHYKPRLRLLLLHAVVLLIAFTIRYNALYFPLISIGIILFSHKLGRKLKGLAIGLIALLICMFTAITQNAYHKETGTIQFSAFGGWQIAANALYGYAYSPLDSPSTVPIRFRKLHILVNKHMKKLSHWPPFLRPDYNVSIYYLWDFQSPLRVYMKERWKKDSITPFFHRWAVMAPLYSEYGKYLIERHPIPFIKHYLWPNLLKYYAPPTGFLGFYNRKEDKVENMAMTWFRWKNNKVYNRFRDKKIEVTEAFTICMAIINLVFVLSLLSFASLKGFKKCSSENKNILFCVIMVWFGNMIFSVFAAPIELRYQLFPMIITSVFLGLLLSFLVKESMPAKIKSDTSNSYGERNKLENIPLA